MTSHATEMLPLAHEGPEPRAKRVIRAMVLDGDQIDIEVVTRYLRTMTVWGCEIVGCLTVDDALERATEAFDILFIDYSLASGTGPEALNKLRAAGFAAPAILLTDMRGEAVLLEAMHAGIVDLLPKDGLTAPFLRRATRNAIEKVDLTREVRQTSARLEETVRSLKHRQEEVESFYHNVSHELKTPLTGAREYVSLVIDGAMGEVTAAQSELLSAAVRNCNLMETCINDMLDGSRIETGKLVLRKELVDLASVLEDALGSLSATGAIASVAITLHPPEHAIEMQLDSQRIYQVIANLVGNAIKFSRAGDSVAVFLEDGPDGAVIRVVDQGQGIEEIDLQRIFERLYQSHGQDEASIGGLGMGLYICRGIVQSHGGSISVESKPGVGSTFSVTLPRLTETPAVGTAHFPSTHVRSSPENQVA